MKDSALKKLSLAKHRALLTILMGSLVILLIILSRSSVLNAQEKPVLNKLAKGVFAFIGVKGNANAGFILTEEGVIVVDSQMNEDLAKEMLSHIQKNSALPILYVINTHHHGDHTFANHVFSPVKGIIAHEETLKFLQEHGTEHLQEFEKFYGRAMSKGIKITLPTITLKDHLTLTFKNRSVQILYLGPGHTYDDIIVYLPEEKILFAGDLIYAGRLPWLKDGDTKSWLKTLDKVKQLDYTTVVPGHGMVGNRQVLNRFEAYLTDLRSAVLIGLLRGTSLEEMKQKIRLPAYQQDLKYQDWLPLHVEKVYREMQSEK
jgi:cyclase